MALTASPSLFFLLTLSVLALAAPVYIPSAVYNSSAAQQNPGKAINIDFGFVFVRTLLKIGFGYRNNDAHFELIQYEMPSPAMHPSPTSTESKSTSTLPYTEHLIYTTITTWEPAETITITERPVTVVLTEFPTTITDTITVTQTPPSPTATPPSRTEKWSAPKYITDMSSFNISYFPSGKRNLKVVNGIPAKASPLPSSDKGSSYSTLASKSGWDNSSSVLQLRYPAHSINPRQKPQGGAEFYASPLEISTATNVTLEYSVFFPADFNWVRGGKLPGLYGGRAGCSGGDEALDCFSTRLMWRTKGAGELYLYAPKDKQTDALCSDQQSTCDAEYGFSIGRESFSWISGAWTTVRQTVSLNTPGKQDGYFTLEVNKVQVINRKDIFYRALPRHSSATSVTTPSITPNPDGGILGPILGGLGVSIGLNGGGILKRTDLGRESRPRRTVISSPTAAWLGKVTPRLENASQPMRKSNEPVGFIGLFFSTFFGGHEEEYATPTDQYVWFKDFEMTYNS